MHLNSNKFNRNVHIFRIFRQLKFHNIGTGGAKRVTEEEIIEIEDFATKRTKPFTSAEQKPTQSTLSVGSFKKPVTVRMGLSQKSSLANLVKRKSTTTTTSASLNANPVRIPESISAAKSPTNDTNSIDTSNPSKPSASPSPAALVQSKPNALSLLSGYVCSDSDESE